MNILDKSIQVKHVAVLLIVAVILAGIIVYLLVPPPESRYGDEYGWDRYAENAQEWFTYLGWDTGIVAEANESNIYDMFNQSYFIYNLAHGGSTYFKIGDTYVYARNVIPDHRLPYQFVFMASCGAFDYINVTGTWEQELEDTGCRVMVGYSGMAENTACWRRAYRWQHTFFEQLNMNKTFREAYQYAIDAYPACNETIVIYGDLDLKASDLAITPYDINKNARIDLWELQECIYLWLNS